MTLPKWATTPTPLSKAIALVIFITFPIFGFIFGMQYQKAIDSSINVTVSPTPPLDIACTMDAKICPDGSTVGRIPPNCEFSPCPIVDTTKWKTYHINNYPIEFQYPPMLTVVDNMKTIIHAISIIDEKTSSTFSITPDNTYDISINPNVKSQEYIQVNNKNINVFGKPVLKYTLVVNNNSNPQTTYYAFLQYPDNRTYSIAISYEFPNGIVSNQINALFDQILSTFKFLDQ